MMPQTTHSTRKRKHSESAADGSSKKQKVKADKKGKGKATEFQIMKASLVVSIPPIFGQDSNAGAGELLDSMLMRYVPAFEGVVLSHSNLEFLESTATIKGDCPFLVSKIAFDAHVWRPRVGMKLIGKINLCSPDHISLLVHKTFNVSIPRHHIPTDRFEFEYGPAENDPEYAAVAAEGEDKEGGGAEKTVEDSGGRWVHSLTNTQLGDPNDMLEFTVIGLTVANEMLSLLGSIQDDPFSPLHVITTKPTETSDVEKVQVDSQLRELTPGADDEDAESDGDTFKALGEKADEARKRAEAEQAQEDADKKKKKKRKNAEPAGEGENPVKKKKKSSGKSKDKH